MLAASKRTPGLPSDAPRGTRLSRAERFVLVSASALGVVYALSLAFMYAAHKWLWLSQGHPVAIDFVAFWSAGSLALHHAAIDAYNHNLQHAAEVAAIGYPFPDRLPWAYPPVFLFVASAVACLPFVVAVVVWNLGTLILQAGVVTSAARTRWAFFLSWAAPWSMIGLAHGQNQFLTSAIIGSALLTLESHPALSGLLLGCLCYKPQLAWLFPIALASGRYWRALAWMCGSAVLYTWLSGAVFGFDTLFAFLHSVRGTADYLAADGIHWVQLQNAYGLARALGANGAGAAACQLGVTAACALGIVLVWRSETDFALKSAGLVAAVTLATPYIFIYDFAVLSVAVAFLFRDGGFDRLEYVVLAIAIVAGMAFPAIPLPAGLIAALGVECLVMRRVLRGRRNVSASARQTSPLRVHEIGLVHESAQLMSTGSAFAPVAER